MTAIHFGAGNIGRGLIGPLLYWSGYTTTFIDLNEELIGFLSTTDGYSIIREGEKHRISNIDGCHARNTEKLMKAFLDASLITTAIGPNILKHIAPTIAQGLEARKKAGLPCIPIIACENMINASSQLRALTKEHMNLTEDEYNAAAIFHNCAIDCIVPPQKPDFNLVYTEAHHEWVVESIPESPLGEIQGMKLVPTLTPYMERKLFSLNLPHAATAYASYRLGYTTIPEGLRDSKVLDHVNAVFSEISHYIITVHGFSQEEQDTYVTNTLERFRAIDDAVVRVARAPIRKLQKSERFALPIQKLSSLEMNFSAIGQGLLNLLAFDFDGDEEAVVLQNEIEELGIATVIKKHADFNDQLVSKILDQKSIF